MGFMDNVRKKMQSWLQINPPIAMLINLQEVLDFEGNAIKNRIWYRGDPNEIEQLYWQIPKHASSTMFNMFWASRATAGMEMRKIHTGLPATMVDLLAGIISSNINDITFEKSMPVGELWEEIDKENHIKKLVEKAVKEVLVVGDGAFKLSVDPEISDKPIIEFWGGDRIDFKCKRGRIQEVIFKSYYQTGGETYELKEHYGHGYVDYELFRGDEPIDMSVDEQFDGLVRTEWDSDDMMAIPVMFYASNKWENRGQSIFDRKIDAFDSFDEAYSQWIDALRAGRTKEYIPENLLPRDPHSGKVLAPNPFDNRYIRTDADMKERADNKIVTESGEIRHESYMATYATALDLCLQGILSPSTLGVDVKKLDNAEAQREKEKVTLYTRDAIIEALQPCLEQLVEETITVYYRTRLEEVPDYECTVSFQDYANPSFESQIETVGKGRAQGILSIEACVQELYGDDKDDAWKEKEIARLKAEQGIVSMEEPAINAEVVWNDYKNSEQLLPNATQAGNGAS
jgi:hypothetical protein